MGHGERFHNQRKMLTPLDQAYLPKLCARESARFLFTSTWQTTKRSS
jgi:hypothetical protein